MSKRRERPKGETLTGRKYPAALSDPIEIGLANPESHRGILSGFAEAHAEGAQKFASYDEEIFRRRSAKLKPLFEFYDIKPETGPGAWIQLAWALACAHVPGFQVGKKHGRPKGVISDIEVCNRVFEYLRQNPGKKITDASRALTGPGAPLEAYSAARVRHTYSTNTAWRRILEGAASLEQVQKLGGE